MRSNLSATTTSEDEKLGGVARAVLRLERRLVAAEKEMRASIARVPPERRTSARNLAHYLALRSEDLRDLQFQLAQLGLSSLGRSEGWVLANVLEVSRRVHEGLALRERPAARRELRRIERALASALSWQDAKEQLQQHAHEIFGPRPEDRHVYIMVTAPSAEEADRAWMTRMLAAHMDVLRINCAHEGPEQWGRIVSALEEARRETRKECRILMDLAGPKIRTGRIAGPRVATWKPARDDLGRATAPARVSILRAGAPNESGDTPALMLDDASFARLGKGDELRLRDARGKKRSLRVVEASGDALCCLADERAYVVHPTRARLWRAGSRVGDVTLKVSAAGAAIDVRADEELVLTGRDRVGVPPKRNARGQVVRRGLVACTLPRALDFLEVGHRVLFDDGRIEARVVSKGRKRGDFVVRVVRTQKPAVKLRAEKGINLPDTRTTVDALTEDDAHALDFVVAHADAVSLSFVKRHEDVRKLHEEIERRGGKDIGVVLKIETRLGFQNLPRLLLEGLRRPPLAVMIARGDLAVEAGFERLAEIQEEILWLCEASHVPAVWATQVLDTLARTGVPSRAEVTDAAASVAAECVMLNKGPFVEQAVRALADILRRMERHRFKKRSLYRKLSVSAFTEG